MNKYISQLQLTIQLMKKFLIFVLSIGLLVGCKSNESDEHNENNEISRSDLVGEWTVDTYDYSEFDRLLYTFYEDGTGIRRYFLDDVMTDYEVIEDWYIQDDNVIIIVLEDDGSSHMHDFDLFSIRMSDDGKSFDARIERGGKFKCFKKLR